MVFRAAHLCREGGRNATNNRPLGTFLPDLPVIHYKLGRGKPRESKSVSQWFTTAVTQTVSRRQSISRSACHVGKPSSSLNANVSV